MAGRLIFVSGDHKWQSKFGARIERLSGSSGVPRRNEQMMRATSFLDAEVHPFDSTDQRLGAGFFLCSDGRQRAWILIHELRTDTIMKTSTSWEIARRTRLVRWSLLAGDVFRTNGSNVRSLLFCSDGVFRVRAWASTRHSCSGSCHWKNGGEARQETRLFASNWPNRKLAADPIVPETCKSKIWTY